jgi:hypothetical protein
MLGFRGAILGLESELSEWGVKMDEWRTAIYVVHRSMWKQASVRSICQYKLVMLSPHLVTADTIIGSRPRAREGDKRQGLIPAHSLPFLSQGFALANFFGVNDFPVIILCDHAFFNSMDNF